jgi:hypothetical protein
MARDPGRSLYRQPMRKGESYSQRLPELELAIERNTPAVPEDDAFYLIRAGEIQGRYRTLQAAKEAWREVLEEAGWQPKGRKLSSEEMLARDKRAREAFEKAEHWTKVRGRR